MSFDRSRQARNLNRSFRAVSVHVTWSGATNMHGIILQRELVHLAERGVVARGQIKRS
jgi:hypothetical protein